MGHNLISSQAQVFLGSSFLKTRICVLSRAYARSRREKRIALALWGKLFLTHCANVPVNLVSPGLRGCRTLFSGVSPFVQVDVCVTSILPFLQAKAPFLPIPCPHGKVLHIGYPLTRTNPPYNSGANQLQVKCLGPVLHDVYEKYTQPWTLVGRVSVVGKSKECFFFGDAVG